MGEKDSEKKSKKDKKEKKSSSKDGEGDKESRSSKKDKKDKKKEKKEKPAVDESAPLAVQESLVSDALEVQSAMSAIELRSCRGDSDSERASIMSWPDSEPEPVAMPAMPKKKAPAPMPASKEWIKLKLNKKAQTNKQGRQEVYDSICSTLDEIDGVCKDMYDTLNQNKNDEAHLPVIKGFAEARGLFKRRSDKTKEHLGNNKTYLDHIRLHRHCLIDGVLFDSTRVYDDNSFKADMATIKAMKRGIMKLMGKDPDQWEYDPAEFEELRKVRDNLTKIWGGHIIKKQKELAKMRGEFVTDQDELDRINEGAAMLKSNAPASAFKAKAGKMGKFEAEVASAQAALSFAEREEMGKRTSEVNMAAEVQKGDGWAQEAAGGANQGKEKDDMKVEEEIDAAQEIIDAMDSFIPDKFYKADVVAVPQTKGHKFAGKLAGEKPDGRGVLVLDNKSQHIGNFKGGKADGKGVFLDKAQDALVIGNWTNGKKEGKFFTLDKKTGQTFVEEYANDKRKEQVAGAVVPDSALKEHFMKRLARLKAKDNAAPAATSPNKNRRASAADAEGVKNRRGSAEAGQPRRGSTDAGAGGRRDSLPKVDPQGQRRNSFSKQGA